MRNSSRCGCSIGSAVLSEIVGLGLLMYSMTALCVNLKNPNYDNTPIALMLFSSFVLISSNTKLVMDNLSNISCIRADPVGEKSIETSV